VGTTYTYKGNGRDYILGIPTRDLTEEDVAALSEDVLHELEGHIANGGTLYVAVTSVPRRGQPSTPAQTQDQPAPSSPQG